MSWTNVSDATDPSWTSVSDATDPSWGATSEETRPGWKQLSIATDSEGGVDFRLKAQTQFPMKALSNTWKALKSWASAFTQGV